MKSYLVALGLLASVVRAENQPPAGSTPVQIHVESEGMALARGYAEGFANMSRPPITIAFQKEGVLRVLEDVKQVRAAQGALVVEVGRGIFYVINPKDVVYLTDGAQVPKKTAP